MHGQQVDLRETNSWVTPLQDLETFEVLEVFAVNSVVPFMLNSKLKALMTKSPHVRLSKVAC
jgi:hypothetical protein